VNVWFQKISILELPPQKGLEFPWGGRGVGWRFDETKKLKKRNLTGIS